MAIFILIVDKMSANQREVISRFESAISLAGVEFGRIDLAIGKARWKRSEAGRGLSWSPLSTKYERILP